GGAAPAEHGDPHGVVGVVGGGVNLPTVRVTLLPRLTLPPLGCWATTLPSSDWLVTGCVRPTTGDRPASDSVDSALDCVWPTVLGTLTCWGWRATVSVTVVPRPTWLPDPGSWLSTVPGVSVLESCCTIDTFRPTLASSAAAESWLWPTTEGTVTFCGPDEMNRLTVLPLSICVPAGGAVRVTWPSGTLSEASWLTVTLKPAAWSLRRACDSVRPSTVGTGAWPGPAEAVSDTVDPSSALVLGWGSWRRILSRGCGETTVVTWTLKPSFSRIAF